MKWKPVVGYEKQYFVSDTGLVRSEQRTTIRSNGRPHTTQEKILKGWKDSHGYNQVGLYNQGKKFPKMVYRLVYEAHVIPLKFGEDIDHMDGSKTNDHISNLQALSRYDHAQETKKRVQKKLQLADFLTLLWIIKQEK